MVKQIPALNALTSSDKNVLLSVDGQLSYNYYVLHLITVDAGYGIRVNPISEAEGTMSGVAQSTPVGLDSWVNFDRGKQM